MKTEKRLIQPACVLEARRIAYIGQRLDALRMVKGMGMALAWANLQKGELDEAQARIRHVESRLTPEDYESVREHHKALMTWDFQQEEWAALCQWTMEELEWTP